MHSMTTEPIYRPETHIGKVLWFENGIGYIKRGAMCDCPCHDGFDGVTFSRCIHCHEQHGEDVFVHYSAIQMNGYRNLEKGQRVEFEIVPAVRRDKSVQAANVRVVRG